MTPLAARTTTGFVLLRLASMLLLIRRLAPIMMPLARYLLYRLRWAILHLATLNLRVEIRLSGARMRFNFVSFQP